MPTAARNKPSSGWIAKASNFIGQAIDRIVPGKKSGGVEEVDIGDYAARSSLDNFQSSERAREPVRPNTSSIPPITRSETIESWAIKPEQAEKDRDFYLNNMEATWNVDLTGKHASQDRELRHATLIDTDAIKKMQASHGTQRLESEQNNSEGVDLLKKLESIYEKNPQLFQKLNERILERVSQQRTAENQAAGSPDIAAKRSSDDQHLTDPKRSIEIAQNPESRPSSQAENTRTVKPKISASEQTKGARVSVNVQDQSESQITNTLQRKGRTNKMRRG